MSSVRKFIAYHNATPIAVSILIVSFGSAFAASDEVRESLYVESRSVVSVDNSYIAQVDLSSFTPKAQIISVTEDDVRYYIRYSFSTIDIVDSVWQDVVREREMEVAKALLGERGDLGMYVTEQLKQLIDRESARLAEVQVIEQRNISFKKVAIEYSGLIGGLLDKGTETLPGYTPVRAQVDASPGDPALTQVASVGAIILAKGTSTDDLPPHLELLGPNPARVKTGSLYTDFGVIALDDKDAHVPLTMYLNDIRVDAIFIHTDFPKTWNIRYEARDTSGNIVSITRQVEVYRAGHTPPQPDSVPPLVTEPPTELPDVSEGASGEIEESATSTSREGVDEPASVGEDVPHNVTTPPDEDLGA